MQPLQCTECGALVGVEKFSWEHTSVQWNAAARARCQVLGAGDPGRDGRPGAPRRACPALSDSVTAAAESGAVPVHDDRPVPTPIVVP
ncbi:hypothetical protein G4H71_04565 [Rhodococcus triatomae]|uniref:Ferredoxin n=1 Tax=Rhodococcus triatomae TaxID=300028 RepID=A0A1G7ZXA5_9NOCA|nr:hypothetical protein [Rhodococcus triatomae]QNG17932.1 hypothetical protein G4H72_03480 [Rhodococcus triatomae]QNG22399.1 hypothetical protein G4H71_04565 [Rhodococcus triatomae]SDH12820.1 hypothetical protein SAMN05444695_101238 [Rhodococcus triatomae]